MPPPLTVAGPAMLATRRSRLAVIQAREVLDRLLSEHPEISFELLEMGTRGDDLKDVPLESVEGLGFFTGELEGPLRSGDAAFAVHSLKDMPTDMGPEFSIAAVLERADPRDVVVSPHGGLDELPQGALVGTDSARRRLQIQVVRPDLEFAPVRGNVPTRLQKLDAGEYDALILAAAGLRRLGLHDRLNHPLDPSICLPAAGQGAIAVESLSEGEWLVVAEAVNHAPTMACVVAERAFLTAIGGGCQAAAGALATIAGDRITLEGVIFRRAAPTRVRESGAVEDAAAVGERAGRRAIEEAGPQ